MHSTPRKRVQIVLPTKTVVDVSQLPEFPDVPGSSNERVTVSAQMERKKTYGSLTTDSLISPNRTPSRDKYINLASMTLQTQPQMPKSSSRVKQGSESPSRSPTSRASSHSMPRFSPKKLGPPLRVHSNEKSAGKMSSDVWTRKREMSTSKRSMSGTLPTKIAPFIFARDPKIRAEAGDMVSTSSMAPPEVAHEDTLSCLSTMSPQALNRQSNGKLRLKREPLESKTE